MLHWFHGWVDTVRTPQANTRLGMVLAAVAGATNAGGFLAVHEYTSHVTGVVSTVVDSVVLGHTDVALTGLAMLVSFVLGAMTTAILVNWGLRRQLHMAYGLPLLLEAGLLLLFGVFGGAMNYATYFFAPLTVVLLCFIMGLQNAVITKISRAEIRTTHLTGLVTDVGIELGKMVYINTAPGEPRVQANTDKLRLHGLLIGSFIAGALGGAMGFKTLGFITTVPLAMALLLLIYRPMLLDARRWYLHTP
ncbi:YoaK family protein [Rhodoferax sp.]|uniref:YoaK family protein n=1 Tax=Rhodoferax sp. TaxID=50421 RepID=UPI0025EA626A|nr:YoaK family protein [Rhodoferax sp.]